MLALQSPQKELVHYRSALFHDPEEHSCARCPKHIRTMSRLSAQHGGKEWPLRYCWPHTLPQRRARLSRRTDPAGDVRVRHGLPHRYFPQRLPYPFLKSGAAHVEGQVKPETRCFNEADRAGHHRFVVFIGAYKPRLGGSGPADRARVHPDRRQEGSIRRPSCSTPPGQLQASIVRRRSGFLRSVRRNGR